MEGINTTLNQGGNGGGGGGGEAAKLAVSITYAALKQLRDNNNLVPGTWYRITDYHTTVSPLITDARSADHQFDVIVRADDASHLNECAFAAHHEGDTYFAACKLEAWELKYRLDNEKWSKSEGTFVVETNDGYNLKKIGTVDVEGTTYILWDASELYDDYSITRAVSEDEEAETELMKYDPETGEIDAESWTSTIESKYVVAEEGQGTIYFMKDENRNQAPYDFKNIQFKRWLVSDTMVGRTGFTDKYLGVLNQLASLLNIDDENDFVWSYTFSSNEEGGEQEDYSLDGKVHNVYENIIEESTYNLLPDNVFFGEYCYCNHLGKDCIKNSFSQGCLNNSFSQNCQGNSFSQGCSSNSFSQNCGGNSFSQECSYNSFSQDCQGNSFSQNCSFNSFSQNCYNNSFSQNCWNNSFSQNCNNIHLFAGVQFCDVTGTGSGNTQNAQILSGMVGSSKSHLSVSITKGRSYTQVAGKDTSGQVKVWNPVDLVQ